MNNSKRLGVSLQGALFCFLVMSPLLVISLVNRQAHLDALRLPDKD